MLEIMFEITKNIVALIIVVSFLELLLPRGDFRPFLNMVVGLVLILTLLTPLWTLLQLPERLEPAIEERVALGENEVTRRLLRLEQLNDGLTLARYREMLTERIKGALQEEGIRLLELALEMEEEPGHPSYGRLKAVRAVVAPKEEAAAESDRIERVGDIHVELGGRDGTGPVDGERGDLPLSLTPDPGLESKLAGKIGFNAEKIEIWVLKR